MKTKICAAFALTASLISASTLLAEEGLYVGATVGVSTFGSSSFDETNGADITFGGVLGHRFELENGWSTSIEGMFEGTSGSTMTYADGGNACTSRSPDWCRVDIVARVRGVVGVPLDNGFEFLAMAGYATAQGLAEDGPLTYEDSRASGYTVGLGAQKETSYGTARFEVTYDNLSNVNPNNYDKTLEIISLRSVLMF